jgi:hypothetical protein
MSEWTAADTNTHQDHVIAHILGATVEGYFVWDETAYLLLDIGFIWNVYLDGEMGLVPHPVAISELGVSELVRDELRRDVDELLQRGEQATLLQMTHSPVRSSIQSADFTLCEHSRRLIMTCEEGRLVVETSLATRDVKIYRTD